MNRKGLTIVSVKRPPAQRYISRYAQKIRDENKLLYFQFIYSNSVNKHASLVIRYGYFTVLYRTNTFFYSGHS